MILPAMGVISESFLLLRASPSSAILIAGSSIGHRRHRLPGLGPPHVRHGESTYAALTFSFLSYLVAIPSAVKVFKNWTSTLYKGSISWDTPMLTPSDSSASF